MGERKDLKDLLRDTDFKQKRIIDDLANAGEESLLDDRGLAKDIKKSEGGDIIKNFFVGVLLIGIVVGSFWISFLVGKKVLVPPVKNLPAFEIPVPKALSQSELENAEPALEQEPEIKEKELKPQPIAAKPKSVITAAKPVSIPVVSQSKGIKYYKVIAGAFTSSSSAAKLTSALKAKGFQSFVKKLGSVFRVQAGAFDTKDKAATLVAKLKAKGFSPTIILE